MQKVFQKISLVFNKIFTTRLGYTLFSTIIIILGSYFAIQYARGSWRVTKDGVVANTGLLNANSFPTGAQVFINDRLVTATDDTIYLDPGEYWVKIVKEGYSVWQKNLLVQKELVTQTNAALFPAVPSLIPLTFTGVSNLHPSPDGQKIVFYVNQSNSPEKNGFYLLELTSNFLSLQSGPKQITDDLLELELAEAHLIWSPNSSELMLLIDKERGGKEFLLDVSKKSLLANQSLINATRQEILAAWEEEIYQKERQYLAKFPPEIIKIATQSAKNVYISPDKKRLLYTATAAATLADNLIPPIPATNNQTEERTLIPGNIYVYDREEDKNFRVLTEEERPSFPLHTLGLDLEATASSNLTNPIELVYLNKQLLSDDLASSSGRTLSASPEAFLRLQASDRNNKAETALNFASYYTSASLNSLQWFPDSKHLLYIIADRVQIMEYDGQNNTVVYSGPFSEEFVYPWPDGSKLMINTRFSPDSPYNLYAINLK